MVIYKRKYSLMSDIPSPLFSVSAARKTNYGNRKACKIRRDSDNEGLQFEFDNDYTLPTTEIGSFIGGGNGFFNELYDQVDTNLKLQQTTASKQPDYIASGINNKPGIGFNSGGDQLLSPSSPSGSSTPMTAFVVTRINIDQENTFETFFGTTKTLAPNTFKTRLWSTDLRIRGQDSSGTSFTSSGSIADIIGDHLWTFVCNGIDKITVYKDGAFGFTETVAGGFTNLVSDVSIGGFKDGIVSEINIFSEVLTERNRKIVENEMATFYNITLIYS